MPTIMPYTTFKGRTQKLGLALRARGKNLEKIDTALKQYEKFYATMSPPGKEQLISDVLGACEAWLKKKSTRSGAGSELFARRRWAIGDLAKQAMADLYAIRQPSRAEAAFRKNKIETLSSPTREKPGTKALDAGYARERDIYVQSGKAHSPISGSQVHGAHRALPNDPTSGARGVAAFGKRFEDLSAADFKDIDRIAQANMMAGHVSFMTKADRSAHIAIPEGGRFVDGNGQRVNAPANFDRLPQDMYAMDAYGNLFYKDPDNVTLPQDRGINVTNFNHSSFNAGKAVVCAGMVTIVDGRLVWVDNNSGHYKPTKENLHTLITLFARDGVDISRTAAVAFSGNGPAQLYKAVEFLVDRNCQPFKTLNNQQEIDRNCKAARLGMLW